MKKTISVILLIIVLFSMCACEKKQKEHISLTMSNKLAQYYSTEKIEDYRVVAALFKMGKDLTTFNLALPKSEENVLSSCEYLLTDYYMQKGGVGVKDSLSKEKKKYLLEKSKDLSKLSTKELSFIALTFANIGENFDQKAFVTEIEKRKGPVLSGFTKFEVVNNEDAADDIITTAYAYMALKKMSEFANIDVLDSTLVFMGDKINDNNTVSDSDSKQSSIATAITLTALLSSGISLRGEISTSLLTACDKFAIMKGDTLLGYCEYEKKEVSADAAADVFFCAVSALYGVPFMQ